jgi:hypothetical protein
MFSKYLLTIGLVGTQGEPVKLIIDTDMGMDVDDVGSICIANAL